MSSSIRTQTKPWDFSHVFDLVNSLSHSNEHKDDWAVKPVALHDAAVEQHDFAANTQLPPQLGDFGKVWQYLGTPTPATAEQSLPAKIDYASDGATYVKPKTPIKSKKGVQWQDPPSAEETETADNVTDGSVTPETPSLTKQQRKKRNRKARLAKAATVSESEADVAVRRTPANKASAHVEREERKKARQAKEPVLVKEAVPAPAPVPAAPIAEIGNTDGAADPQAAIRIARAAVAEKLHALQSQKSATPYMPSTPPANRHSWVNQAQTMEKPVPATVPVQRTIPISTQSTPTPTITPSSKSTRQQTPAQPSKSASTSRPTSQQFVPSSVQPPNITRAAISSSIPAVTATTPTHTLAVPAPNHNPRFIISPKIIRSGPDRHWALLLKLLSTFPASRATLLSPHNLLSSSNPSDPSNKPLHVFVDASNIFIGFTAALKLARGIHPQQHVPAVQLSFDALALLMERRRPVAKRVLVGSAPETAEFDVARRCGYEVSVLDKVYKARELSERQVYFKELDRARKRESRRRGSGSGSGTNGGGSSAEALATLRTSQLMSSSPQHFAAPALIEQGVDEILHLKILESILDAPAPGIIVLATGDAAAAEYSAGFMAMVQRALVRGWEVEVVCWRRGANSAWRSLEKEWGVGTGQTAEVQRGKFQLIFLEEWAEEMLEM